MPRQPRRVVLPLLLAIPVLALCSSTPALEPVTLDDVIRLVEAGVGREVIERQVARTGSTFDLGVDEILRLRRAGAEDSLIAFLQEHSATAPETAEAALDSEGDGGATRQIPVSTPGGRPAVILTNLPGDPSASATGGTGTFRGVISSSYRSESPSPEVVDGDGAAAPAEPAAGALTAPGLAFPANVEITVRHEGEGTEGRIAELEERLGELEAGGEREVGDGWYPRHPINDFSEYPVYGYPYWGYGFGFPVVQPVKFRTIPSGPFLSFTGAAHAGFDPFRPVGPCVPGQACSVAQRVAHPYPPTP